MPKAICNFRVKRSSGGLGSLNVSNETGKDQRSLVPRAEYAVQVLYHVNGSEHLRY